MARAAMSDREIAAIMAIRHSALARERTEAAREAVQTAIRSLDKLVRRMCAAIERCEGVSLAELLIEVSRVIGYLQAADECLSEAMGYAGMARRDAEDAFGRKLKATEYCANAAQCGERAQVCSPADCPLFTLRIFRP